MIRRTVLASLQAGERPPVLRGPHFAGVLAEMNSEHQALTRSLLGAGAEGSARKPSPPAWASVLIMQIRTFAAPAVVQS